MLTAAPVLAQASQPAAAAPSAESLEQQFRDPPNSARPRVWWHWMNGNVTKDGIAKDMAWMKRVGIGGLQNFDANLKTPQIVDKRLVYMTPEWKDAFRFAASEADRRGLELAIASSPGWSETGGPWVKPEDGLKKLVWSETELVGGRPFSGTLKAPPSVTGPFQSIKSGGGIGSALSGGEGPPAPPPFYRDVAVLAVPLAVTRGAQPQMVGDAAGHAVEWRKLVDDDLGSAAELAKPQGGVPFLRATYASPQTVRSATLFVPGAAALFMGASYAPQLEASDDGKTWRSVAEIPLSPVPTTIAFAPVTARQFRVIFNAAKGGGFSFVPQAPGVDLMAMGSAMGMSSAMMSPKPLEVAEFRLSAEDRIDRAETKAGFAVAQDYYALAKDLPEVRGVAPSRVVDLTGRLRPDGSLDWTPPPGRWRVLRLGYSLLGTMNHPATAEATGLEVDKFDGPAVRRYLDHYLGMYKDAAAGSAVPTAPRL
jgi:hypothetical protein